MPLSWNEIKSRAIVFCREFENDSSEDAEAKTFWDGFFDVFGISRLRVATFEQQVRKLDNKAGFIDLLWKGNLLVEHMSRGKNLEKAYKQSAYYFPGIPLSKYTIERVQGDASANKLKVWTDENGRINKTSKESCNR